MVLVTRTLSLSTRMDGVIILYLGTSLFSFSKVFLSKRTIMLDFSLTLPLLHFFFLPLLEDMAAFAFCSFVFC